MSLPVSIFLAALSGCLVSLAFPKPQISFLVLVGLTPFLRAIQGAGGFVRIGLVGFTWGVCFFGVIIEWIPAVMIRYGHLDGVSAFMIYLLLIGVQALFPTLFALITGFIALRWGAWGWLASPFVWITLEWLRNCWPMGGFPWGQLGYAMVPNLGFMQVTSWTGIYGATFLVLLCNVCLVIRFQNRRASRIFTSSIRIAITSFLLVWLSGFLYLYQAREEAESADPVRVTLLQGNIAFENDLTQARRTVDEFYLPATRRAFSKGSQVVIWPESPTPYSYLSDSFYRQGLETLTREGQGALIFNDIVEADRMGHRAYFNSALFLNEKGLLVARYDKNHLVPFGEYLPGADLLGFAGALTREVGTYTAGESAEVAVLNRVPVGAFICYESIFPELVRRFPQFGAHWLVNLTNDSWYGDTAAPYQHLQMAVVRAIENRRFLVRAANSGISAFITPLGDITASRGLFRRGILTGQVFPRSDLSVYSTVGDAFVGGCAIITLVWIVSCSWRRVRHRACDGPEK